MSMDSKRNLPEPISAINMTPLVDVCLVLVIIFMVTAPLIAQHGIMVNSVKKEVGDEGPAEAQEQVETIYVKVLPEGVELNGEKITLSVLPFRLHAMLLLSEDKAVYINPVGLVRYGRVVEVLDVVRQSGAQRLAVLNDKEGLLERTLIFKKKQR